MGQTRGVAGFHYYEPMLLYQNENAEPEKLGVDILNELKECEVAKRLPFYQADFHEIFFLNEGDSVENSHGIHAKFRRHFPKELFRRDAKTAYELFEPLQGTLKPWLNSYMNFLPNSSDFIDDSFFCKWGYVFNIDKGQFEILRGDQTEEPSEPLYERFDIEKRTCAFHSYSDGNELNFPCRIIKAYDVDNLPSEEQFLQDLEPFKVNPHLNLKPNQPRWFP